MNGSAWEPSCCAVTSVDAQQERQLVTKDATIREIHHRVKNNLQTVAALLRMQAPLDDLRRKRGGVNPTNLTSRV